MTSEFEQKWAEPSLIAGFLIVLILSTILRKKLWRWQLRREGQIESTTGSLPSVEKRLSANRVWASGEIKSKGGWLVAGLWLLAVAWNLTFGVSFFKQFGNPDIKTGGLVVLGLFALGGLPAIAFAVRESMRQLRFGTSTCRISGKVGLIGEGIKGTVTTRKEVVPEGDYKVILQCLESYAVGSGKQRTTKTDVRWQGKTTIRKESVCSRSGISFSIDIPSYPPETGDQLCRGSISWQLTITAATKGIDYSALFVVPVFKVA